MVDHARVEKVSFLERIKRQPIYREKFLHTIWICWAFIMLGLVEALFGPTFPDLRIIIDETLDTSSWLFTSGSAGFLLGSAITGFLYDRYNRLLILILAVIGMAVTQAVIPFCSHFWLMLLVKFLSGLMAASLDTGGNAEVFGMWGSNASSFMQALHFCFSLGGVIAPFIAQPFLTDIEDIHHEASDIPLNNATNESTLIATTMPSMLTTNTKFTFFKGTVGMSTYLASMDSNISFSLNSKYFTRSGYVNGTSGAPLAGKITTNVKYAYIISAGLVFASVLPFLCMYYIKRGEATRSDSAIEKQSQPTNFHSRSLPIRILLLLLLSSLMCVYCGTEDTYAGFLMTYVISDLKWSKSNGSIATSVYWICFGGARLFCIPLVRYAKTSTLMLIFSTLLALSYVGLLIATWYDIQILLWIFIGAPGLAMSILFPAVFTWTNDNFVNVSGKISSLLMTSASVGIMLFPLLFGYTMDHLSPIWFVYLLIGQSVLWVFLFLLTLLATKCLLTQNVKTIDINVDTLHNAYVYNMNTETELTKL